MKVSNISLYGDDNFGNKLQTYAIQKKLNNLNIKCITIINNKNTVKKLIKKIILKFLVFLKKYKRYNNFLTFNRKYLKYKNIKNNYKKIDRNTDFYLIGSDQVWNYNFTSDLDFMFAAFSNKNNKIAFSASFGVEKIPDAKKIYYIHQLNKMKHISVREFKGKAIIEELTGRKDVQVLVDPTMLLTREEWKKVEKKPKNLKEEKYILNYFLGDLSETRKEQINKLAKKRGYKVINILDKEDPFYNSGPAEFIYLEEHAELICTDSFHSCVFGILMDTPFVVFDREDKIENMNSRIETLLEKFKLKDRKYNGILNEKSLNYNYIESYKILEKERIKANKFLKKALNINNKIGDVDE